MPTSRDMAIFVLTTTTTQPITLPLAHAHGVIRFNLAHRPSNFTLRGKVRSHICTLFRCNKKINETRLHVSSSILSNIYTSSNIGKHNVGGRGAIHGSIYSSCMINGHMISRDVQFPSRSLEGGVWDRDYVSYRQSTS